MSDLLKRDRAKVGTTKSLPDLRPPRAPIPKYEKPRPTRLFRWIEWMALVVGIIAAGVLAIWLGGRGGDEAVVAPEHGAFTQPFIRDTSGQNLPRFVGTDPPNLDPDVYVEHGPFTDPFIRDTSQQNLSGFVGSDPPNLDPDEVWAPEHGEFTDPFIRDTSGQSRSGFVGSHPPDLDPDVP